MRPNSFSAFIFSTVFHGFVAVLAWLFTYALQHQLRETPKVFELVAGEGDNYAATEAPALGVPGGVKFAVPTPPAPQPEPVKAEAAPVTQELEATPPPKAVVKTPNYAKDVKRIAAKREARLEAQFRAEQERKAKEEAVKAKRLTKEEFDKLNKGRKAPAVPTTGAPKVARIDAEGIAQGVVGGSTANKTGGAGGQALAREAGEEIDAYYSLLKQRLKAAFEQPPGLSDTLIAYVEVRSGVDGTLSGARITKSSRSAEFDRAVLEAVTRTRMPGRPDRKNETITFPFTMREKDEG